MKSTAATRSVKVGMAASTVILALATVGAMPAQAAHNPRPGGPGGPPAGQSAPSTSAPSTSAPTTSAPTTSAPSTSAPSTSAATTSSVTPATGTQPQGGPRPAGIPLRPLVGDGTITADQARAVREQLRTDARLAREQARTTALDTLVSEGALTPAQAAAIVAAGRGGLRTLVSNGTLTAEQAREVQAEFAEYGSTDTTAASLAALVAAGVLTQEQADAIASLVPAPGSTS